MSNYSMDVRWSAEDGGYVAVCPELGGVSAFGESASEAVTELEIVCDLAVEAYEAEGWVLPASRQHVEYSGQFRLRVPRSLHAWLSTEALREGVSLNTFAITCIAESRGRRDTVSAVGRVLDGWRSEARSLRYDVKSVGVAAHTVVSAWPTGGTHLVVGEAASSLLGNELVDVMILEVKSKRSRPKEASAWLT